MPDEIRPMKPIAPAFGSLDAAEQFSVRLEELGHGLEDHGFARAAEEVFAASETLMDFVHGSQN